MKAKITGLNTAKEEFKLKGGVLYTLRPKNTSYLRVGVYHEKNFNGDLRRYFDYIHEGELPAINWDTRETVERDYHIEPFTGTVTLSNA